MCRMMALLLVFLLVTVLALGAVLVLMSQDRSMCETQPHRCEDGVGDNGNLYLFGVIVVVFAFFGLVMSAQVDEVEVG